ncbi:pollen receptor-like kinase 4 [Mercurialis annua]|uniref:pollen receptor-like kinase 4 n=1 Tax=Mercurialis annua TaxID=3986 RepID=UPI0021603FD7|nr:pollen receptor-like kinase 4 [Mercurialis annua]
MVMGALAPTLARNTNSSTTKILILVTVLFALSYEGFGQNGTDSDALLKFKLALNNSSALYNWNSVFSPCEWDHSNWVGVLCLNGSIWGLKLEHMALNGTLDVDSLVSLSSFRTLSLMDNQLAGAFPDIKKLGKLKALYLSNNRFAGQIPDDAFLGMGSLKRVFMANNMFTGDIPISLAELPRLTELRLEGNQFKGRIPDFQQHGLKAVNLASNELSGPIPPALSRLNPESFSGNKELCGAPLDPCTSSSPSPAPKEKLTTSKTVIIFILALIVLAIIALVVALLRGRRTRKSQLDRSSSLSQNSNKIAPDTYTAGAGQEQIQMPLGSSTQARRSDKLSFVREDVEKFELNDLLRASAEVLGSGTFGSSYKASVGTSQSLVVKRYRHMNNVSREEFHEHMRRLGRLKHPNLLRLAAYYYRREEKLLVYEFVANGSLASHLHSNNSLEGQGLDWPTRLKIIKGVAKGLAYLYSELPILVPHGHLKSSNVLLESSFEPLLTDYTLRPVINPQQAHNLMIAYKSPEYAQTGRTSDKTDMWCFGILILEILTGKFPENYITPGYDSSANLASWVNKMVKEKRTSEVFDKDMKGGKYSKGEMINVLKIGLSCCEEDVESRLDIKQIVEKLEQLKEGDVDIDDRYGSSEGNHFMIRGSEDGHPNGVDR